MPKIINSEKLKVLLLTKIEEKKEILFGKFSESLTKNDRSRAWEAVFEFGKSIGYSFSSDATYAYVRDTVWPNIRKASIAKRDKLQSTGEGNEDGGLSVVDEKVISIIGSESAAVIGLSITESMDKDDKYLSVDTTKYTPEPTEATLSACLKNKMTKKRNYSAINNESEDWTASNAEEKRNLQIANLKLSNTYLEKKIKLAETLEFKAQLEIRLLQNQLGDNSSPNVLSRSETAPPSYGCNSTDMSENTYQFLY